MTKRMILGVFTIVAFISCWSFLPAEADALPMGGIPPDSHGLNEKAALRNRICTGDIRPDKSGFNEKAILCSRICRMLLLAVKRNLNTGFANRLSALPPELNDVAPVFGAFHTAVGDCSVKRYHFLFYRKLLLSHIIVRAGPVC